jgi:hypothetical protein
MLAERRAHPRRPLVKTAILAYGGGHSRICRMKNLSLGGALLEVSEAADLPDDLKLYFDLDEEHNLIAVGERCRVVRRTSTHIAVAFGSVDGSR